MNPKNLALLEEWKLYLRTVNRSPKTIYNYDSDINIFFCWLLEFRDNKFFVDVSKKDILFFQDYMMNTLMLGSCRIRRLKDALSSFSNYIENFCDEEYPMFRNIVRKIESPSKKAVREKTVFEDWEIELILNQLVEKDYTQIACLLALACYSGARRSELIEFKLDYFDSENVVFGSLYKTPEKIKTKGRDGGKYIHKYTLKKQFDRYLYLWKVKRKQIINLTTSTERNASKYLFVQGSGGRLRRIQNSSMTWYAEIINRILEENGINKVFYWHSCRHYFTTYLKKQGLPSEIVIQIIGWAEGDGKMLAIYDDRDKDDELGKYFNEDGIVKVEEKRLSDL